MLNKTMDRNDLMDDRAQAIVAELNELVKELRRQDQAVSSWYGHFFLSGDPDSFERINRGYDYLPLADAVDDHCFPWFLYWEIAWILMNTPISAGERLLDLGGSSSLFSYYLASKGVHVTTVDLQTELVENGNRVARHMGWNLENHAMDMRTLSFDRQFHHVTSVCVYEHIPMYDRVKINKRLQDLLEPGGKFSITFDYYNPSRSAQINSPQEVHDQFVVPSGLAIRGNPEFADNGLRYLLHPFYHRPIHWRLKMAMIRSGEFSPLSLLATKTANDYTFGSLFLEKPA